MSSVNLNRHQNPCAFYSRCFGALCCLPRRRRGPAVKQSRYLQEKIMGFDQYHEPAEELSQEVRTFARMIKSLIEEAEAIDWYEQRISVEKDKDAKKIMMNTQKEEFIHFAMDLEFLLRKKKKWNIIMKNVLFKPGDIV